MTGRDVANASVNYDPDAFRDPVYVMLDFNARGGERFGAATTRNVGRSMAIVLDGAVRSAPKIIEPILVGRCRITMGSGAPSAVQREAKALVVALKQGAMAAPLRQPPVEWIERP